MTEQISNINEKISEIDESLEYTREKVESNLGDEVSKYHYQFTDHPQNDYYKSFIYNFIYNDHGKSEYHLGETVEYSLCKLKGYLAFWRNDDPDTTWHRKFSETTETPLWLVSTSGDLTHRDRVGKILREFTEADAEWFDDQVSFEGFCIPKFHRMRALLASVEDDPESAHAHIEWLRTNATHRTYREGFPDRKPLTLPLLSVLEAILDADKDAFEAALGAYLTEDLGSNASDLLPYDDPDRYHVPIRVVGMIALARRHGIETAEIDPPIPDDIVAPDIDILPEAILEHDWPPLNHDPSDRVQRLWAMIDGYDYPENGVPDSAFGPEVPDREFEVGGTLDSPDIETPVWPPTVPYGHQTGDGIDGYQEYPLSVGHHRLAPIDKQLHDGDREAPVFQYAGTEDFLRQALGPLTSVSETVYLVVTEESIAFLTDLDPASFGMCFSTRERHFHVETPGVVALDADHLWAAADNVVTNASETGVTIWMDGNEELHAVEYVSGMIVNDPANDPIEAVKSTTAEREFRYQPIDARVPSSLPETLPDAGELTTFMTGVDSRNAPWSWAAPPATQLVLGSTFWIDSWLREDDSERLRLRGGLVNEDGTPGEGVLAIDSEGTDPTYRTGPSFGPTEDYSMGTEDLAGLVWPLSEGGDPTEEVADEFAPDTGTIPPDTIGLTADSTYDRGTLWKFFRGFYHGKPPRMYGSFGTGDRLRLEYEVDSNSYLVYEQSAIDS